MHKTIFKANFEESKKVVNKTILTRDGAGIGDSSSMKISKKITTFLLMGIFFGVVLYGIGIFMPNEFVNINPDESEVVSYTVLRLIGRIGVLLEPLTIIAILSFLIALAVNLFPQKNYARQLVMGNIIVLCMGLCGFFSCTPFIIGLAVNGTGVLGCIVQFLLGGFFISNQIRKNTTEYKEILYGEKNAEKRIEKSINFNKYLNVVLSVLLVFSILNRNFFHIGGEFRESSFFLVILGFSPLLIMLLIDFVIIFMFPPFMSTFYFVKYAEQYRDYFEIPDDVWHVKTEMKSENIED